MGREVGREAVEVAFAHRVRDARTGTIQGALDTITTSLPVVEFDGAHTLVTHDGHEIHYRTFDGALYVEAAWEAKARFGVRPRRDDAMRQTAGTGFLAGQLSPLEIVVDPGSSKARTVGAWDPPGRRRPTHRPYDLDRRRELAGAHLDHCLRAEGRTWSPTLGVALGSCVTRNGERVPLVDVGWALGVSLHVAGSDAPWADGAFDAPEAILSTDDARSMQAALGGLDHVLGHLTLRTGALAECPDPDVIAKVVRAVRYLEVCEATRIGHTMLDAGRDVVRATLELVDAYRGTPSEAALEHTESWVRRKEEALELLAADRAVRAAQSPEDDLSGFVGATFAP